MKRPEKSALVIGAGPAGLTAGIELLKTKNFLVTVVEKDAVVGGLAKTLEYKKCRYDIGPHHFITDSDRVLAWWHDLMADDFQQHKRFTRIYYKKHFFSYPLEPSNVIRGLSLVECAKSVLSYVWIRCFPIKNVRSFQDWVTNKFGKRLFSIFFKTYTEKVWGITCDKISADWAAQRIKGFSLSKAIFYAFFGSWFKKNKPRTLSDVFYYPSRGSGTLWERAADIIKNNDDATLSLNADVVHIEHGNNKILAVATSSVSHDKGSQGAYELVHHRADYFFSTMPLRDLILSLQPGAPDHVVSAAKSLSYRGLITVNLIINKINICPDHWLYIHEKEVRMGRIGNMNNFSACMVYDPSTQSALSLEYFSFIDESLWLMSDDALISLGKHELEKIGLVTTDQVVDGMVLRTREAYPVYDEHYKQHLSLVLDYLSQFSNLQLMGRNGLHRYNNMDVAMLSAFAAVENVITEHKKTAKTTQAAEAVL